MLQAWCLAPRGVYVTCQDPAQSPLLQAVFPAVSRQDPGCLVAPGSLVLSGFHPFSGLWSPIG